jgi:hypothetical protein
MVAAFLSMSSGLLVHYSAGPFALFLAAHYLLAVWPWRQRRLHELVTIAVPCTALLSLWFGWSLTKYGLGETIGSNTTAVALAQSSFADTALRAGWSVICAIIPHPLRISPSQIYGLFEQPSSLGFFRDYVMTIYGNNLVFAMGSVGGPLVVWLVCRALSAPSQPARLRRFWLSLIVTTVLTGIVVHPTDDPLGVWQLGVAQICEQPLILLGVAYLAARYLTLPALARWAGLLGLILDFGLGVFLQFSLANRVFHVTAGHGRPKLGGPGDLSAWALKNWLDKSDWRVVFWGDYFTYQAALIQGAVLVGFAAVVVRMIFIFQRRE